MSSKTVKKTRTTRETLLSGGNVKKKKYAEPVKQFRVLDITKWLSLELIADEYGFDLDPEIRARLDEMQ